MSEIRAVEIRATQIGTLEVRRMKVTSCKVRTFQVAPTQIGCEVSVQESPCIPRGPTTAENIDLSFFSHCPVVSSPDLRVSKARCLLDFGTHRRCYLRRTSR